MPKSVHRAAASTIRNLASTYRKTVLPSGLRVVTEQIPYVRSVSVGIWINSGSRDENEQNNGISHFIEHMVFKGTTNRKSAEISRSIESVGGYLNAFTSKEHTCYYARVLDEYTDLALDVLSDLVLHATFPEKELEKEKGVIIEELRNSEDDPDDIIHDVLDKALFGSHPIGFPVIGTEPNVRRFTRDQLMEFRKSRYSLHRIVVAAAGNLDHDRLVAMVERAFRLRTTIRRPQDSRKPPRFVKGRTIEHRKPIQQAHVCLGTPAYSIKSKQRYQLLVLNTLLGDGMSSRLFQKIRERYGFAYTVYSYVNMLSDTGSFACYIGTDVAHVEPSIELIRKELDRLSMKPVPKSELARTKAQLKGNMMLSLENIPNRMMRLGSSELYFQELTSLDSIIRNIDAVTQEDLLGLAKELFREEKFSRVIFRPDPAGANSLVAMPAAAVHR
ncbi:MAG: pitrilysin family protein [Bacteroidota bacterium]